MSSVEAPEGRTVNSLTIILVKCAPEGPAPLGRGVFLHYISINGWPLRGWKPPNYFYLSLNTVFDEQGYLLFKEQIEETIQYFRLKGTEPTLKEVNKFLADNIWNEIGIEGIIFDDKPTNQKKGGRVILLFLGCITRNGFKSYFSS